MAKYSVSLELSETLLDDLINALDFWRYSDRVDARTQMRAEVLVNTLYEIRYGRKAGFFGQSLNTQIESQIEDDNMTQP